VDEIVGTHRTKPLITGGPPRGLYAIGWRAGIFEALADSPASIDALAALRLPKTSSVQVKRHLGTR
jgi:hypothetical protein